LGCDPLGPVPLSRPTPGRLDHLGQGRVGLLARQTRRLGVLPPVELRPGHTEHLAQQGDRPALGLGSPLDEPVALLQSVARRKTAEAFLRMSRSARKRAFSRSSSRTRSSITAREATSRAGFALDPSDRAVSLPAPALRTQFLSVFGEMPNACAVVTYDE